MKCAAVDCSFSGPRQPRKVGPTKARKIALTSARPLPAVSAAFNSASRSRLVAMPRVDEEFGDQLVLGTEMIVHRRKIDAGRRHNVAQRDVGEATLGIKPFGGVEDQGTGPV